MINREHSRDVRQFGNEKEMFQLSLGDVRSEALTDISHSLLSTRGVYPPAQPGGETAGAQPSKWKVSPRGSQVSNREEESIADMTPPTQPGGEAAGGQPPKKKVSKEIPTDVQDSRYQAKNGHAAED